MGSNKIVSRLKNNNGVITDIYGSTWTIQNKAANDQTVICYKDPNNGNEAIEFVSMGQTPFLELASRSSNFDISNEWSITAWIKIQTSGCIFGMMDTNSHGFAMPLDSVLEHSIAISTGSQVVCYSSKIPTNTWFFMEASLDKDNIARLFINGHMYSAYLPTIASLAATSRITWGNWAWGPMTTINHFNGQMYDATMYNGVLHTFSYDKNAFSLRQY